MEIDRERGCDRISDPQKQNEIKYDPGMEREDREKKSEICLLALRIQFQTSFRGPFFLPPDCSQNESLRSVFSSSSHISHNFANFFRYDVSVSISLFPRRLSGDGETSFSSDNFEAKNHGIWKELFAHLGTLCQRERQKTERQWRNKNVIREKERNGRRNRVVFTSAFPSQLS